jgi:hypothetical protein
MLMIASTIALSALEYLSDERPVNLEPVHSHVAPLRMMSIRSEMVDRKSDARGSKCMDIPFSFLFATDSEALRDFHFKLRRINPHLASVDRTRRG